MKQITYRMGELVSQGGSSVPAKTAPFIFVGLIQVDPLLLARFEYDTVFIANDSVNTLSFSMDGGRTYMDLLKTEVIVWDRCTSSEDLYVKASAINTKIRVALWKESL